MILIYYSDIYNIKYDNNLPIIIIYELYRIFQFIKTKLLIYQLKETVWYPAV